MPTADRQVCSEIAACGCRRWSQAEGRWSTGSTDVYKRQVQGVTLQPTVAGLVGGENVCCCHIRGSVTNQSSVAVHAELLFEAKGTSGQAIGTAIVMEQSIQPGATRSFLAVGITAACREVSLSQVVADKQIRLKGLWEPPA